MSEGSLYSQHLFGKMQMCLDLVHFFPSQKMITSKMNTGLFLDNNN